MLRVLAAQGTILQLVAHPPWRGLQAVSAKSRTSALVVRCANSRRVVHRARARAEIARVLAIGTYKTMQSGVLDAVPTSAAEGPGGVKFALDAIVRARPAIPGAATGQSTGGGRRGGFEHG